MDLWLTCFSLYRLRYDDFPLPPLGYMPLIIPMVRPIACEPFGRGNGLLLN